MVSPLFFANSISCSIASIRKPPLPEQVSKTTSSMLNLAKSTIKRLIWSGVNMIFLLSTFPALDSNIL